MNIQCSIEGESMVDQSMVGARPTIDITLDIDMESYGPTAANPFFKTAGEAVDPFDSMFEERL